VSVRDGSDRRAPEHGGTKPDQRRLAKLLFKLPERLPEGPRTVDLFGLERVSEPSLVGGGPSADRGDHDQLRAGEASFGGRLELRYEARPLLSRRGEAEPRIGVGGEHGGGATNEGEL